MERGPTDSEQLPIDRPLELIRQVLLFEWDPIGVSEYEEAQDEYDSYVGMVYSILEKGESADALFEYIWWLETVHIGLIGRHEHTRLIADRIVVLRELWLLSAHR